MSKGPEGLVGKLETILGDVKGYRDRFNMLDPAQQGAWRRLDTVAQNIETAIYGLYNFNEEMEVTWV